MPRPVAIGVLALLVVGAVAWVLARTKGDARTAAVLEASLAQRQLAAGTPTACPSEGAVHLLVLGQSNAGNHGQLAQGAQSGLVMMTTSTGCSLERDPLPGATGRGGSQWSRLPDELAAEGVRRPVLLSLLAVDASSVGEWTEATSPLTDELRNVARRLVAQGRLPDAVLWQQGEADARRGTTAEQYEAGLRRLVEILRAEGIQAPLWVALSTRCRSEPSETIRRAGEAVARAGVGVLLGPDTDALQGPEFRHDGCHFSAEGLAAASRLWARALAPTLAASQAVR